MYRNMNLPSLSETATTVVPFTLSYGLVASIVTMKTSSPSTISSSAASSCEQDVDSPGDRIRDVFKMVISLVSEQFDNGNVRYEY